MRQTKTNPQANIKMGGVIALLATTLAISSPVQAATLSTYASGFTNPTGIAFDSSGNLFVANSSNTITQVTPSGIRSTFATDLNNPSDLAFNASGNLFVADTFSNRVKGFSPSGSLIFNTNTSLNQPRGLDFKANGDLTVTNPGNASLVSYASDNGNLDPSEFVQDLRGTEPFGITNIPFFNGFATADTNVFTATTKFNGVVFKTINGPFNLVGLPLNSITLDLVFDRVSDNIYVSDFVNNVIYKLNSQRTLSTLISSGLNQPSYLAIKGDNLYISDNGSGNILEFQLRTPIPFEFNPALGIGVLGGLFAAKKLSRKFSKK